VALQIYRLLGKGQKVRRFKNDGLAAGALQNQRLSPDLTGRQGQSRQKDKSDTHL
jgi:hypothetical protein